MGLNETRRLRSGKIDSAALLMCGGGFFFIMCTLFVGGFDLLPDAAGYLLLTLGLFRLKASDSRFGISAALSILGIALSAVRLFIFNATIEQWPALVGVQLGYGLAMPVFMVAVEWFIIRGIRSLAVKVGAKKLDSLGGTLFLAISIGKAIAWALTLAPFAGIVPGRLLQALQWLADVAADSCMLGYLAYASTRLRGCTVHLPAQVIRHDFMPRNKAE